MRIAFAGSRIDGLDPFSLLALTSPCLTEYRVVVSFAHKIATVLAALSFCGRVSVTAVVMDGPHSHCVGGGPPVLRFRGCAPGGAPNTSVLRIVPVITGLEFDEDAGCYRDRNGDSCGVVASSTLTHSAMAVMGSTVLESLLDMNDVHYDAENRYGEHLMNRAVPTVHVQDCECV